MPVTAGALSFAGQVLTLSHVGTGLTLPVTAGVLTLIGRPAAIARPALPGTLLFTGQEIGLADNIARGALPTVTVTVMTAVPGVATQVVHGVLQLTGQNVVLTGSDQPLIQILSHGSLSFTGQTISLSAAVPVLSGSLAFTGQVVIVRQGDDASAYGDLATVTVTPVDATWESSVDLYEEHMFFSGQDVILALNDVGNANANGLLRTVGTLPPLATVTGTAEATGTIGYDPSVTMVAPAAAATGADDGLGLGLLGTATVSAPAGTAAGNGGASGLLRTVVITPPGNFASGGASVNVFVTIPGVIVWEPLGTAAAVNSASASGSLPVVVVSTVNGTARLDATGSGDLPTVAVGAITGIAFEPNFTVSGDRVVIVPPESRRIIVAAQHRIAYVEAENRLVRIRKWL